MIELRYQRSYIKGPGDTIPLTRSDWVQTALCIGGLRFIVKPRPGRRHWGVDRAWRWSWRGVTFNLGKLIVAFGWMAPQFRDTN